MHASVRNKASCIALHRRCIQCKGRPCLSSFGHACTLHLLYRSKDTKSATRKVDLMPNTYMHCNSLLQNNHQLAAYTLSNACIRREQQNYPTVQ